jgi:VanZ family protein
MSSRTARIVAIVWTLLVLGLHAIPRSQLRRSPVRALTEVEGPDKLAHFVLFALFGILWMWAARSRRGTILIAGLAYAVALEIMQSVAIAGRTGSVSDFVADAVGLVLGLIAMSAVTSWKSRTAIEPFADVRDRA